MEHILGLRAGHKPLAVWVPLPQKSQDWEPHCFPTLPLTRGWLCLISSLPHSLAATRVWPHLGCGEAPHHLRQGLGRRPLSPFPSLVFSTVRCRQLALPAVPPACSPPPPPATGQLCQLQHQLEDQLIHAVQGPPGRGAEGGKSGAPPLSPFLFLGNDHLSSVPLQLPSTSSTSPRVPAVSSASFFSLESSLPCPPPQGAQIP